MKPLFLLCFLPLALSAQDTAPALAPTPDPLTAWLVNWVLTHPKWAALALLLGNARLVLKPLFGLLHTFVKSTASPADDELLAKIEASPALRFLIWLLDYVASIKVVHPDADAALASTKPTTDGTRTFGFFLAFCLLPFALGGLTGCAALGDKWDSLSSNQQAAIKSAAKVALSIGLAELGDSVHELRPYTQKLTPLFETTFATAKDDPAALGDALAAGVQAVVPPEHQARVKTALKAALQGNGSTAAASGNRPSAANRQSQFNLALAGKL